MTALLPASAASLVDCAAGSADALLPAPAASPVGGAVGGAGPAASRCRVGGGGGGGPTPSASSSPSEADARKVEFWREKQNDARSQIMISYEKIEHMIWERF